MRILHTVAYYDTIRGGGAAVVVQEVSRRLAARGHDVTVATTAGGELAACEHGGVKVRPFDVRAPLGQSVLGVSGDVRGYLEFVRGGRFDLILNYAAQTWCTDLTCRLLDTLEAKTILVACGYSGLIGWRRPIYRQYFKRLPAYLRKYSAVVYHSESYIDKAFGDEHGIQHYRVIPNGVASDLFSSVGEDLRKRYSIETPYVLLSVGNHYANKGHGRLLKAFNRVGRKDITLVVIGRDCAPRLRSCWAACQKEAARSCGRILLLTHSDREEVVAAYRSADLFLSGSQIEAFPLVIIEAMASGTPYVAYPAGNIAELKGGVIVETVDEMARQIRHLLTDKARREQIGGAGRDQQRSLFEWDTVAAQYEGLYRDLVTGQFGADRPRAGRD